MDWIIVTGIVGLVAYSVYRLAFQAGKRRGSTGGFKAGRRHERRYWRHGGRR